MWKCEVEWLSLECLPLPAGMALFFVFAPLRDKLLLAQHIVSCAACSVVMDRENVPRQVIVPPLLVSYACVSMIIICPVGRQGLMTSTPIVGSCDVGNIHAPLCVHHMLCHS